MSPGRRKRVLFPLVRGHLPARPPRASAHCLALLLWEEVDLLPAWMAFLAHRAGPQLRVSSHLPCVGQRHLVFFNCLQLEARDCLLVEHVRT